MEIGGLVFSCPRDISYEQARAEIEAYIDDVRGRDVYISEIADALDIDMDLIELVLEDIEKLKY